MFEFILICSIAAILLVLFHPFGSSKNMDAPIHRDVPPVVTVSDKPVKGVVPPYDPTNKVSVSDKIELQGKAFVVDGDTITIKKTQIRLFGIDAPEMNHPFGIKSKWALVTLCKGQEIKAKILTKDVHDRTVARCYLPDGRDISAEMVKLGLAIDWPKYSDGEYGDLEPDGIRRKLWLADARQKGRMYLWDKYDEQQLAKLERNGN